MTVLARGGLSNAEVAQRVADGLTNDVPTRASRSVSEILRANVFTRINAILAVLLAAVLVTGSVINGLFGLLIVANSVIGIVQELRAKQTLDRLAIIGQAKPMVRREGGTCELMPSEVVLDDVIELGPGDQVVVDGEIVEEHNLEVDESFLTGEADPVTKGLGDTVMSGSFVVAGTGAYRATRVGGRAYAAKLAQEARKFSLVNSDLRSGISSILRFITYLLIPTGLLIIYSQLFTTHVGWRASLLGAVGALVPMVPEGLVLMTSIAFAVGVIRLGRRQCLVQELPAIEGLARVDVVCADKTGTLTESGMRLSEVKSLDDADVEDALAAMAAADTRPNASMRAIAEVYDEPPGWIATASAAFKSATKWSGVSFAGQGNWVLGAPDVLLDKESPIAAEAEAIAARGMRVLLLARSERTVDDPDALASLTPAALVILEQRIRRDAAQTLRYFVLEGVAVKIISGDNAASVTAVAAALGLAGETVDARTLADDPQELRETLQNHLCFARVSPDQKRAMVIALQLGGNTVAMTGDGVNDVLALKDADIGVAMGNGSPAARAIAEIVLLDNKFATLPHVVAEGRRVIGNVERVSTLFLTKTVYAALLALVVGLVGVASHVFGTDALPFPFQPVHATITAWFTIGIPAFILSLAPNHERAQSGFVRRVMLSAVPSGVVIATATILCYVLAYRGLRATATQQTQASTSALITLLVAAVWVLAIIARPYNWWRVLLITACFGAYVTIFSVPPTRKAFDLDPSNLSLTAIALSLGALGAAAIEALWWLQRRVGRPRTVWEGRRDRPTAAPY
jgi:cation-transporting P-type ATPase E